MIGKHFATELHAQRIHPNKPVKSTQVISFQNIVMVSPEKV